MSGFDNLAASPSVKIVTELQLTIEFMLCAAAEPITDERHIQYQIVVSWNAKLHGLYITLFVAISYSVATLRLMRTLNPLLRASCADTFMT